MPGATAQANSGGYLRTITELMRYAFPGNLTGPPAISFPAGYDQSGLPVGMQARGRKLGRTCAAEHRLRRRAGARTPPASDLLPDPVAPQR